MLNHHRDGPLSNNKLTLLTYLGSICNTVTTSLNGTEVQLKIKTLKDVCAVERGPAESVA